MDYQKTEDERFNNLLVFIKLYDLPIVLIKLRGRTAPHRDSFYSLSAFKYQMIRTGHAPFWFKKIERLEKAVKKEIDAKINYSTISSSSQ